MAGKRTFDFPKNQKSDISKLTNAEDAHMFGGNIDYDVFRQLQKTNPKTGRPYFNAADTIDNSVPLPRRDGNGLSAIQTQINGFLTHQGPHPKFSDFTDNYLGEIVQMTYRAAIDAGASEHEALLAAARPAIGYSNGLKGIVTGVIDISDLDGDVRLGGNGETSVFHEKNHKAIEERILASTLYQEGHYNLKVLDATQSESVFDFRQHQEKRQDFKKELQEYNEGNGSRPKELRDQIELYQNPRANLISDSSGFSKLTKGIGSLVPGLEFYFIYQDYQEIQAKAAELRSQGQELEAKKLETTFYTKTVLELTPLGWLSLVELLGYDNPNEVAASYVVGLAYGSENEPIESNGTQSNSYSELLFADDIGNAWSHFSFDNTGNPQVQKFDSYQDSLDAISGSFWYEIAPTDDGFEVKQYDPNGNQLYSLIGSGFGSSPKTPGFLATIPLQDDGQLTINWGDFDEAGSSTVSIAEQKDADESLWRGAGTYNIATGISVIHGGTVDANDIPLGGWTTEVITVAPESGTVVRRTAPSQPDGVFIGGWTMKVEYTNYGLRNTKSAVLGNSIGTAFGSSLGQAIADDNVFAQIGSETVLSTVLGNIGQTAGAYLGSDVTFEKSVESAFEDFGQDLYKNLKSSSVSAVSSFLTAELSDALDIGDSFGGQLLDSSISKVTSTMIDNVVDYVAGGLEGNLQLLEGLTAANVVTSVSSFVGGYLGRQVFEAETTAGAIGGSIGSAVGAAAGASSFAASTTIAAVLADTVIVSAIATAVGATVSQVVSNLLLPGIGAFIGVALGTYIGDWLDDIGVIDTVQGWFDHHPRAKSVLGIDAETGEFYLEKSKDHDGGDRQLAKDITRATADILNGYLDDVIGGEVLVNQEISGLGLGHYEDDLRVWPSRKFTDSGYKGGKKFSSAEDMLEYAALDRLSKVQVAGGHLYVKRVLQNTAAETLEALNGDIKIAEDYAKYLENRDVIDTIIQLDPNSTFAAGWVITLIRAEELGITEWSESDFYGGLKHFFNSYDSGTQGITLENLNVAVNDDGTLILNIVVDGEVQRTIEIEDFAATMNYAQLAPDNIAGTSGNDLWVAEDGVNSVFDDASTADGAESNDILLGGTGNDTINAGLGNDFVQGGAGNDNLSGGEGDDALAGNEGDDILTGGSGGDELYGNAGNDTLQGNDGNDYLVGGTGADAIDGGEGFDVASYENAVEGVTVDLTSGTASDGDTLSSIEGLTGSQFNDSLTGDANDNLLNGGSGNDTLDGGDGRDTVNFLTSAAGVEINLETGTAVTQIDETTTETDTLLNIEDAIGSLYDDTLVGSTSSGKLDASAGNDTIILQNDDVDIANGAATYDIQGGDGFDAISFEDWDKSRGVELDLSDPETGHTLNSIEQVIGSNQADKITGSDAAEVFDGGRGNDVFIASEGDDIYVLTQESDHDQLGQVEVQTEAESHSYHGRVKLEGGTHHFRDGLSSYAKRQLERAVDRAEDKFYRRVDYDEQVSYGDAEASTASLVFDENVTYHDIFGGLNSIDEEYFSYDRYFVGTKSEPSLHNRSSDSSQLLTRQELLNQLDSIDLIIGIKAADSYLATSDLSQLTDSFTIQGGGILPSEIEAEPSLVGFSDDYELSAKTVGYSEEDNGDNIYTSPINEYIATHQGTRYDFGANQEIEHLFFADSGHIDLDQVKYFKDGSTDVDTLIADADKATWLYGGESDDSLQGSEQADILVGGEDNDLLEGHEGEDQYAYWLGDGHDIIDDPLGTDIIIFGGGITQDDIKLKVGKLDDLTDHSSFRNAAVVDATRDLKLEIYDPETDALTGSITIVNFQSQDQLRFAGNYEVSLLDFLSENADEDTAPFPFQIEAEDITDVKGYNLEDDAAASGGQLLEVGSSGKATVSFNGPAGVYNVILGTFDETDGQAQFEITQNDRVIGTVELDQDLGSKSANAKTKIERTVAMAIEIQTADRFAIGGTQHKGESARLDYIRFEPIADALVGSAENDTLTGDSDDNHLVGSAGSDVMDGGDGNDTASYGASSTGVTVDLANGTALGGDAEGDTLANVEKLVGSNFDDVLYGEDGVANELTGNAGNDELKGGTGGDTLYGNDGDDRLYAEWHDRQTETAANVLDGGNGNDELYGAAGNDTLIGGAGGDTIYGGDGIDVIDYSNSNAGVIVFLQLGSGSKGHAEDDRYSNVENVMGSEHNDSLYGSADNVANQLRGKAGDDTLSGGQGSDELYGGAGNDTLYAEWNNKRTETDANLLDGGDGDDKLYGASGGDTLIGGTGNDVLVGRAGADVFRFAPSTTDQQDIVKDFELGVDTIDLSAFKLGSLSPVLDGAIQVGSDTQLLVAANGTTTTIELEDVSRNALMQTDFIL